MKVSRTTPSCISGETYTHHGNYTTTVTTITSTTVHEMITSHFTIHKTLTARSYSTTVHINITYYTTIAG